MRNSATRIKADNSNKTARQFFRPHILQQPEKRGQGRKQKKHTQERTSLAKYRHRLPVTDTQEAKKLRPYKTNNRYLATTVLDKRWKRLPKQKKKKNGARQQCRGIWRTSKAKIIGLYVLAGRRTGSQGRYDNVFRCVTAPTKKTGAPFKKSP